MKPKFMIKYGKEEHLQQLVDGKIRFAPSQTYVRLEEAQHNKGQGDLLEGKMKIKMQSARLHSIETNELIRELPDRKSTRLNSSHKVQSRMPSSA